MAATIFVLTEKQDKNVSTWYKRHACSTEAKRLKVRVLSYTFTPNGVGVGMEVKCSGCDSVLDITDYDTW